MFPHGAFVIGDVEAVRDFERSTRERAVQATDKESGVLVWSVSVLDADPDARKDVKTVTVKISAPHQPVPPEAMPGMPFRPVEFEGLTVTPYLDDKRNRIAFSYRATGMRAPQSGGKPSPRTNAEAA
ncbi:plasmid replication, integration and excision activator [Pseudonocardia sp. 73-21]|uniref:plasmid replication, integration and excision activator n=1 Tax=Pseudonocardia sp. 73-21 TaxID=1895809 RepID=UPI0026282752|nr:plasmid replication, integration and excision activator [Pseudonocardia sp. 73-21]